MAIPRQIVLLIPRLASEFDGEVVATVRAMERVLKSAGLDWHALAAALSEPSQDSRQRHRGPPPPPNRSFAHEQQIHMFNEVITWLKAGAYKTNDRESDFLESLRIQLLLRPATERQEAWLLDLHRKIGRAYSRRK